MQLLQNESLSWLVFDHLSECPEITHGVFLRRGGVSSGDFDSLNFGFSQGDLPENVEINRSLALSALSIPNACGLYQEHSNIIVEASSNLQKGDGLMTNQIGIGLMIQHADCQVAIIYDPKNKALANIHCGWRGNVKNIYQKAIESMRFKYGSCPENLLVGISPSLSPQRAEFRNYQIELPKPFWEFQVKPTYFDLWEISKKQLTESGVLPHHIEIAGLCTYSNPELFFSYRRKKVSGRHATIAAIRR